MQNFSAIRPAVRRPFQKNSLGGGGASTPAARARVKGIIRLFPKFWSHSVETVNKVGKCHDPTYFVSKLPHLQMPGPESWSVCQPLLAPRRLQALAHNLYNPINITLGWNFIKKNSSWPDKGTLLQIRGCVPSTLHRDISDNLRISLEEYLKMWNRISLPMLPYEMSSIYP